MQELTHVDESGAARMVDVSEKPMHRREAVAEAFIRLQPATLQLLAEHSLKKGDALAVARLAGIQAAKKTWDLIPLCHQLPLSHASIDFAFEPTGLRIRTQVRTIHQTGVEMEALTAASVAALAIYDMAKAVDKEMVIEGITLLEKSKLALE